MELNTKTLLEFYLDNINIVLPSIAKAKQWNIIHNHCWARILLDNLFKDCWYNHLDKKKVAYKQLNKDQLIKLRNIIQLILNDESGTVYKQLNINSLTYRNKLK